MSALPALDLSSGFLDDMTGGDLVVAGAVIILIGISIALILKGFRRPPPRD